MAQKIFNVPFTFSFILTLVMITTLPLLISMGATVPGIKIYISDVILLLAVFLFLLEKMHKGRLSVYLTGLDKFALMLLVSYIVFYLLAIAHSMMLEIAWVGFKGIIGRIIFAAFIILVVRNFIQFKLLLDAMLLAAVASCMVSVLKLVGVIPLTFPQPEKAIMDVTKYTNFYFRQNYGMFYNSGRFAMWHSFAVVYSLGNILFLNNSFIKRLLYVGILLLNLFTISISFSRNSIVITVIGLILMAFVYLKGLRISMPLFRPVVLAFLLILLAGLSYVVSMEVFSFVMKVRGVGSRLSQVYLGFTLLFPNRWLWGAGPNVFSNYSIFGRDLHSTYMSVWVESGILNLGTFLSLLFVPLFFLFRELTRNSGRESFLPSTLEKMNIVMGILGVCWAISIAFFPADRVHETWLLIGLLVAFNRIFGKGHRASFKIEK